MAKVLIPLAQGCEELEAVTLIDLLRRADIQVVCAGLQPGPVVCSRGTVLVPDRSLAEIVDEDFDMVVLPGGQPGTKNLSADRLLISLLQKMARQERYTCAICAAPAVLAAAGLLKNKQATAFPGSLHSYISAQNIHWSDAPVVIDGKVVTSQGPGTAMDFALSLISLLRGPEVRTQVEAGLQRPHAS
jgi:4-methyl-5(b-hydroxyethyl)-thiazole monophosphate biosynthesis